MSHQNLLPETPRKSSIYFHTKGQRSHNIQATAATTRDSPDSRSQLQGQKCEKHQKIIKRIHKTYISLRAFIFNVFLDVPSLLKENDMRIDDVKHRSSMLNQLSNFAPLCRFRRCALCHLRIPGLPGCHDHYVSGLSHWTLTLATHHPRISWFVLCQPKGRSNFCSVARSQWFTLITKSSTKTDWLDLTVYVQNRTRACNVYTCLYNLYISMKILELWNWWCLCFAFLIIVISCHLNISQQHCAAPLSFAAVPRPGRTSPC